MEWNTNNEGTTRLEKVLMDIKAGEKAYGTLVTADVYPHKRPYFKKRHFKMADDAKVLERELNTITNGQYTRPDSTTKGGIFEPMETMALERSMTRKELDVLILHKEQELVESYQQVLDHPNLPNVTMAILQAQAEDLNNLLLGLKIDTAVGTYPRNPS